MREYKYQGPRPWDDPGVAEQWSEGFDERIEKMSEKTLDVTSQNDAKKKVSDVVVFGNTDAWQLLCKASSHDEAWMKSTKVMNTPKGCVVQASTQQGSHVAEALTFIPDTFLLEGRFVRNDGPRPRIVCLCGSTKFVDAYREANFNETMAGKIVLSIGCNLRTDEDLLGDMSPHDLQMAKKRLDDLHCSKIDLADEVLILNVGGYVGESTASEIRYAHSVCKVVRYLEEG